MTPEEEVKLRAELAKSQADNSALTVKFSTLETDAADAAKVAKAAAEKVEADAKADKVKLARDSFTALLEGAVTDKVITPAQRETYAKVLRLDDDEAVLSLSVDDVKALLTTDADTRSTDHSRQRHNNDNGERVDYTLSQMTYDHMAKSGSRDFSASLDVVMRANPELAIEYIDSNGEVKQ